MLCEVIEVRVEWGDTLWDLAERIGVGVENWHRIQAANGLKDDIIYAGEVLKVPLPLYGRLSSSEEKSRKHKRAWVVEWRDTAWDISQRLGISLENLQKANASSLDDLFPDDVVHIPEKTPALKSVKAFCESQSANKPNWWNVFLKRYPLSHYDFSGIDEYREKHRIFLNALRDVESSFIMPAPTGDRGLSIGPLQISRDYHMDAWWLSSHGVNYENCNNVDYSERTVINYWLRYCSWALKLSDYETLARTHNGGPQFWLYLSTRCYWNKVQIAMKKFGYHQDFPPFTASIGNARTIHLFSSHINSPILSLDTKVSTAAIIFGTSSLV